MYPQMVLAVLLGILGGIGTGEVVVLLAVVLLFFGAKRIPDLAKGLGKGIKEFKDAKNGVDEEKEK
jgi:sec-independent protein translocase protein TatA